MKDSYVQRDGTSTLSAQQGLARWVFDLYGEVLRLHFPMQSFALEAPPPPEELSFRVAARLDMPLEEKQGLLELRSTQERLERLVPILEGIYRRLEEMRELQRRVGGNGRMV